MTPRHYYNEFDPHAAAWLRELINAGEIPAGDVDTRSICDVQPDDVRGYTQRHWFAGIGGWALALRLAGWPEYRPADTGSCPCQPYSAAGRNKGNADARNLWPAFYRIIRVSRPDVIFGEQVEGAVGHGWLDGISADLESEGYAVGSVVLGAHSVGAPHIRQRLFWVADSRHVSTRPGYVGAGQLEAAVRRKSRQHITADGLARRVVHTIGAGPQGLAGHGDGGSESRRIVAESDGSTSTAGRAGHWSQFDLIPCRDGKARRVEPGPLKMAPRLPVHMVRGGDSSKSETSSDQEKEVIHAPIKEAGSNQTLPAVRSVDGEEEIQRGPGSQHSVLAPEVLQSEMHGGRDGGDHQSSESAELPSPVCESSEAELRTMRSDGANARSSQGREPYQQRPVEFADFVQLVPSSLALAKHRKDNVTAEALQALLPAGTEDGALLDSLDAITEAWGRVAHEDKKRKFLDLVQRGLVRDGCVKPLVDGLPRGVVPSRDPGEPFDAYATPEARVMRLRGYGNAINPYVAAEFIRACLDIESGVVA